MGLKKDLLWLKQAEAEKYRDELSIR